jgi:hypothetical protein
MTDEIPSKEIVETEEVVATTESEEVITTTESEEVITTTESEEVTTTTESEEVVSEQEDINTIISNITETHQRDIAALMNQYTKIFESQESKILELLNQIEDLKISKQQEIEKSSAVLLENIAELTQKVEELQSQSNLKE